VSVALVIVLGLQVAFLAIWSTAAAPASLAYLLIAVGAFAMGIQLNAVRSVHVPGVSTTAFTATFIDLASDLATWTLAASSVRRLAACIVSLAVGSFLGDWMLSHAHRYAPSLPAGVTVIVIAIALVALKPLPSTRDERRRRPDRLA
jgi:uncharacterized membrane protein YoaK (UPF0700 family)